MWGNFWVSSNGHVSIHTAFSTGNAFYSYFLIRQKKRKKKRLWQKYMKANLQLFREQVLETERGWDKDDRKEKEQVQTKTNFWMRLYPVFLTQRQLLNLQTTSGLLLGCHLAWSPPPLLLLTQKLSHIHAIWTWYDKYCRNVYVIHLKCTHFNYLCIWRDVHFILVTGLQILIRANLMLRLYKCNDLQNNVTKGSVVNVESG